MVARVNPVRPDDDDGALFRALNVAANLFKIGLNEKQRQKMNELKERQISSQEQLAQAKQAEEQRQQTADVLSKFEFSPERPEQGPAIPIGTLPKPAQELAPEGSQFAIPSDVAQQQRKAKLAKAKADRAEKKAAEQEEVDRIDSLADDFRKESKETLEAIRGFKKVDAAASNPDPTGATDLALLFGFMKSIDPGSVVREREFETAEEAQPLPERVEVLRDRVLLGARLTPEQRQRLLAEAKRAVQGQLETQQFVNQQFRQRAEKLGVDPKFVINPIFEKISEQLGPLQRVGDPQPGTQSISEEEAANFGTAIGAPSANEDFDPDAFLQGR